MLICHGLLEFHKVFLAKRHELLYLVWCSRRKDAILYFSLVPRRVPRILRSKMANFAAGFSKFCKFCSRLCKFCEIAQIWKLSAQSTKLGWTLSILKFNFQIKNPF